MNVTRSFSRLSLALTFHCAAAGVAHAAESSGDSIGALRAELDQLAAALGVNERPNESPMAGSLPLPGEGGAPCAEHAKLYLETGPVLMTDPGGSVTLEVEGEGGAQQFTFASAMSMERLIDSLNIFSSQLGVEASQSIENRERIEVRSTDADSDAFVRIEQLTFTDPIVFATPDHPDGTFGLEDFGEDGVPGDLDCDQLVNFTDLLMLLDAWGACDPGSECPADLDDSGGVDFADLLIILAWWS